MICGSRGSKSRLAKAAGAEPAGQMRDEKLHAVVARSKFPSQIVQNTKRSDHFWKLRCWKSARRCGAKHISKSKCTKHTSSGPLLEVEMWKKCTPLWREAHFEINMLKNTRGSDHLWTFRCRLAWQAQGIVHLIKVSKTWGFCSIFNYNHHYTTLHSNTLHYNYSYTFSITLNHTTLHYTTLHSTTLHYTTLHHTTLHYTTFHYTTLHYITLHYTTLHSTTLHYTTLTTTTTTLHYIPLHYTTLHYTTLHSATLHYIALHYTTLHSATLHYTTLHYTNYNYSYNYNYNYNNTTCTVRYTTLQ